MSEIWRELLPDGPVDVFESFFDAGGHSILAVRLLARIRDGYAVDLRIADLFAQPRIADLAALVDSMLAQRDDEVSRLIDEIRDLSPEELNAILEAAGSGGGEGVAG